MHADSRDGIAAGIKESIVLLTVTAIYWALALLIPWGLFGVAGGAAQLLQYVVWLIFVLAHGTRRYGWDTMFMYFAIAFLVSWAAETASIASGFPFGGYHYTDLLGVKIGAVPMAIMAAYIVAGYLAWTMATVFLGNLGTGIGKRNLLLVPFVASTIMVMWDFCLDPLRSTIDGAWIWEDGGAYFGVPLSNFAGWYLATFLIFLLFALYLYRFRDNERLEQNRIYWTLAAVMYLGLSVEYLLGPFTHTTNLEIHWSLFLGSILTMVFTALLNIIVVLRLDEECF